ncbi:MAG TPA: hypothetical protein VLE47_00820 [Candidatus Saccharimonadales bacterium]|nr:hypothetical protein [Candidatus Saccharimonadales bacterium]
MSSDLPPNRYADLPIDPYEEARGVLLDLIQNHLIQGKKWRAPQAGISHHLLPGQENVDCEGAVIKFEINETTKRVDFYCRECDKNLTIDFETIGVK